MYTFELNNERKDANFASGRVNAKSAVVEIFSAMRDGKDLSRFGKKADQGAKYIIELNSKASAGDLSAVSELNEIRRFAMEPQILQEAKLLGIYGNYKAIGYNDSCEVEVPEFVGNPANKQALGQDVNFPVIKKNRIPIATVSISAGYAVDYRKAATGDMSAENELKSQISTQIRNRAAAYVVETIYKAIKDADGVKYHFEGAGLTKTGVDSVITPIRRFGKPTITGDYALVSQLNAFAGYQGTTPNVTGISEAVMKEIHDTGLMGMYNGAIVSELPNPYDTSLMNAAGTDFQTVLPQGIGYVIPSGGQSPIYTVTRGGLTSISGTDVTTGQLITRYDLEVGALVAPGREYMIGLLGDTNLTADLANY